MSMKEVRITRGGQISVPAELRHRWKTSTLALEDHGDHAVLRPAPQDDAIAAAAGAFADPEDDATLEEIWAAYKLENREIEERKWGVLPPGRKWRDPR